jgi:hypothetical protein
MNEFGPELDRDRFAAVLSGDLASQDSPADAGAGFEDRHATAGVGEHAAGGEAGGASPHDEHIVAPSRHDQRG